MNEKKTEPHIVTRRRALQVLGVGVIAPSVLSLYPQRSAWAEELKCNDPSYYDEKSAKMRKTLQYVEKSEKEGKICSTCMQWIPPKEAKNEKGPKGCGGCKLFSGPVNPKGYCLSFAPKQS